MRKSLTFICVTLVGISLYGADAAGVDYLALSETALGMGDLHNGAIYLNLARKDMAGEVWQDYTLRLIKLQLQRGEKELANELFQEYIGRYPQENGVEIAIIKAQLSKSTSELNSLLERGTLDKHQLNDTLSALGSILMQSGNYTEAADAFEKLTQLALDREHNFTSSIRYIFALILAERLEESSSAIAKKEQEFTEPKEIAALQRLTLCQYAATKDFENFEKELALLTKDKGKNSDYFLAQALIIAATKSPTSSVAYYRLALDFSDTDAQKQTLYRTIANNLQEEKRYSEAADTLLKCFNSLGIAKDSVEILKQSSNLYATAKKYDQALKTLELIVKNSNFSLNERIEVAELAAHIAELGENPQGVKDNLQFIIEQGATPEIRQKGYFALGEYYFKNGDYVTAIKSFAEAAKLHESRGVQAEFWIMLAQIRLKMYGEAYANAERLVKVDDPKISSEALFYMAQILEKQGKNQEALNIYTIFTKGSPNSIYRQEAEYTKAKLAEKLANYVLASNSYFQYSRSYPKDKFAPEAIYHATQNALLSAQFEKLKDYATIAENEYPNSPFTLATLFVYVDYLRNRELWNESIASLDVIKNLATNLNDSENLVQRDYILAEVLTKLSQTEEALELVNHILKEYPQSAIAPWAAILGANINSNNGEYKSAQELYTLAQELRPNDQHFRDVCQERIADCAYLLYGQTHQIDDLEIANLIYKKLKLNSDNTIASAALYKYGQTMKLLNQPREAVDAYSEVLYRALKSQQNGEDFVAAWAGKALYDATKMLLEKETISGAREAVQLLKIGCKLNLNTGEDFDKTINNINQKYRL